MSDVLDMARNKWRGILMHFGVPDAPLKHTHRHFPCPLCGGKDRFRFDDKAGSGSSICNQCGSRSSGINLLMDLRGWSFAEAAREVEAVLGKVRAEPVAPGLTDEQRRALLVELWKGSSRTVPGDLVDVYLTARGIGEAFEYPDALRTHPMLRVSPGLAYPAMLAVVSDIDGKPINMHRTWINGTDKAPLEEPRKMMPGSLPEGACVRLSVVQETIGIAEGVETAFAASNMFNLPVWSAINAPMLAKWWPPVGVSEVVIFGDNDINFTGQAAAYSLARRLTLKGIKAEVSIPRIPGTDWNDETRKGAAA